MFLDPPVWHRLDGNGSLSARWGHTAVALGGGVLLFGGHASGRGTLCDSAYIDCTPAAPEDWRWCASPDQLLCSGTQPGGRLGHAACPTGSPACNRMFVFGGIVEPDHSLHAEPQLPPVSNELFSATLRSCHTGPPTLVWDTPTTQGTIPDARFGIRSHTEKCHPLGELVLGPVNG